MYPPFSLQTLDLKHTDCVWLKQKNLTSVLLKLCPVNESVTSVS